MTTQERKQIPIVDDLFAMPSAPDGQPRLIGSRCPVCGEYFFPKRAICANCQNEDLREVLFGQRGELYSFTLVRIPPFGYKGPLPYAQGQIQLPEGPLVNCLLTDYDYDKLQFGMEMEIAVAKLEEDAEGHELMAYVYRPVSKDARGERGS